MVRPLALIVPLSLLALACTPVADGDPEPSSPGEDEDEVQVAAVAEASHALKTPAGCSARPSEATPIDPQAEPDQGQLKIQRDGAWLGLPLQELRYDTVVVGTLAETTVTQIFYNPLPDRLEAIYTFPLPDDAAVDDYWIRVGQRQIRGALKRREDAEKTYEDARRSGQTAALMTQERPNLFNQAVANIAPGETIEVEMHLVQPLHQRAGRYTLALPTVVGPRYIPAGVGDAARITPPVLPAGAATCTPVDIHVAIDTTLPIEGVRARHHELSVTPHPQGVAVALAGGATRADRDFELSWRLGGVEPRAELMAYKQGADGYFALTIQPPHGFDVGRSRPRELVFVVDVSGSMMGPPLDTARAAIERALAGMRSDDTFNLITFANGAQSFAARPVANTADNRAGALAFLGNQGGFGGGTEMLTGISAALDVPKDPERMRMVLFMTDGYIGNEAEIFRALAAKRGDARLFALGVGSSVNRYLVDGLGRLGRGAATVMGPGERPDAVVTEFYEHVDRPVLTDISIDWGGLAVADASPGELPDLFAGQPVVVYGRYTGELAGSVKLRGKLGGAAVEIPVDLARARASEHDGLASLWARRRIDDLTSWPLQAERAELPPGPAREQVIDLALRHRILTAWTAFVAVEERKERQPDGTLRTVHVPVDMPMGVGAGEPGLGHLGLIGKGGGGGYGSGYGRGAGAGFGGRGTRVPTVRQAKAEVTGSIDHELIRRIVRAHINEVRHCYNQGLAKDPNLKGRLVLDFTIDPTGAVGEATVVESTLTDPDVGTCVAKTMLRWKFPASPPGAGPVKIRYPFVLEPG